MVSGPGFWGLWGTCFGLLRGAGFRVSFGCFEAPFLTLIFGCFRAWFLGSIFGCSGILFLGALECRISAPSGTAFPHLGRTCVRICGVAGDFHRSRTSARGGSETPPERGLAACFTDFYSGGGHNHCSREGFCPHIAVLVGCAWFRLIVQGVSRVVSSRDPLRHKA